MFDTKRNCVVVVGAQWGDEGKGKIVDVLAQQADLVVRYQGGANAGHTVVKGDEEFILHQIPSGILHQGTRCIIGNGVVLDPDTLLKEVDDLVARGVDVTDRLIVSDRAHLVLPYHKLLDCASEKKTAHRHDGTWHRTDLRRQDRAARRANRRPSRLGSPAGNPRRPRRSGQSTSRADGRRGPGLRRREPRTARTGGAAIFG